MRKATFAVTFFFHIYITISCRVVLRLGVSHVDALVDFALPFFFLLPLKGSINTTVIRRANTRSL